METIHCFKKDHGIHGIIEECIGKKLNKKWNE
jgi:hypothetical protein